MQGYDDGVMVALLPTFSERAQVELPHMTLVYAGRKSELSSQSINALGKAASSIAMFTRPVTMRTLTKDVFGDGSGGNPKVDVLRFHPNLEVVKMRDSLQDWDTSKFPFRPHMTVGPEGSWQEEIPRFVAFDKVCFVVGDDKQEFHMNALTGVDYG